jgi:nucleotide-binding universal stress UspA family protein
MVTNSEPMAGESWQTIVVGVDGSQFSVDALVWAAHQAETTGSRLRLVTAWDQPTYRGVGRPILDEELERQARGALEHTAQKALGAQWANRIEALVVSGQPAEVLIRAAEDADLLVVGSHGRGGFASMLLGSVSHECTAHAPCPVVVVRAGRRGKHARTDQVVRSTAAV